GHGLAYRDSEECRRKTAFIILVLYLRAPLGIAAQQRCYSETRPENGIASASDPNQAGSCPQTRSSLGSPCFFSLKWASSAPPYRLPKPKQLRQSSPVPGRSKPMSKGAEEKTVLYL